MVRYKLTKECFFRISCCWLSNKYVILIKYTVITNLHQWFVFNEWQTSQSVLRWGVFNLTLTKSTHCLHTCVSGMEIAGGQGAKTYPSCRGKCKLFFNLQLLPCLSAIVLSGAASCWASTWCLSTPQDASNVQLLSLYTSLCSPPISAPPLSPLVMS